MTSYEWRMKIRSSSFVIRRWFVVWGQPAQSYHRMGECANGELFAPGGLMFLRQRTALRHFYTEILQIFLDKICYNKE